MRPRIKLIYVLAAAFVIIAGGIMAMNRLNGEIADYEVQYTTVRINEREMQAEESKLNQEWAQRDSDSFIRNKARTEHHYLSQGEILFVVENPEALYGDEEMSQTNTAEDTEG